jgi:uncharacterized DUF497 family protein
MVKAGFESDLAKDRESQLKHCVGFAVAQFAFGAAQRVIAEDTSHRSSEQRYFCFGAVGGGYWRRGRQLYERENQIRG